MVETTVVTALNENDDKFKDIHNLRAYKKTKRDLYRHNLILEQQKQTEAHKPYDFRSGWADVVMQQEDIFKRNKAKGVKFVEDVELPDFDFEKYGDAKRFVLVSKKDWVEEKLLDGMRQPVIVGDIETYQSKIGGTKISIFVPKVMVKK
jgi:hypothetical protein